MGFGVKKPLGLPARGPITTKTRNSKNISRNYFVGKGFFNAKATITTTSDSLVNNSRILKINVEKGNKFKINE